MKLSEWSQLPGLRELIGIVAVLTIWRYAARLRAKRANTNGPTAPEFGNPPEATAPPAEVSGHETAMLPLLPNSSPPNFTAAVVTAVELARPSSAGDGPTVD